MLLFGRRWYAEPDAVANAINYAKFFSRSHPTVIRVYDDAGKVIETHEQAGESAALLIAAVGGAAWIVDCILKRTVNCTGSK